MRDPVRRQARTLALACCLALCSTQAGAVPSAGAQQKPDPLFDEDFDELGGDAAVADPIEPFNRVIFGVNEAVDFILWTPATRIYRFAVPRPARAGIRRVFLNLNSTSVLINKILQLRLGDAAKTLGRFLLNTTAGWGGLFDPAAAVGWEPQHADFGETLASMRVPPGPYLVLPFFGPSSIRDGVGTIVQFAKQNDADAVLSGARVPYLRGYRLWVHASRRESRRDPAAQGLVGRLLLGAPQRLLAESGSLARSIAWPRSRRGLTGLRGRRRFRRRTG